MTSRRPGTSRPTRELAARHNAGAGLESALDDGMLMNEDGTVIVGPEALRPILQALASTNEKLSLGNLDAVISHLRARARDGDEDLASELERLVEEERLPVLSHRVAQVMYRRSPDFVYFDDRERELDGEYDLNDVADDPPPALANFAALAEVDLVALRDAKAAKVSVRRRSAAAA